VDSNLLLSWGLSCYSPDPSRGYLEGGLSGLLQNHVIPISETGKRGNQVGETKEGEAKEGGETEKGKPSGGMKRGGNQILEPRWEYQPVGTKEGNQGMGITTNKSWSRKLPQSTH
jgi:hypothetical protein